jgi:hypothetical protein
VRRRNFFVFYATLSYSTDRLGRQGGPSRCQDWAASFSSPSHAPTSPHAGWVRHGGAKLLITPGRRQIEIGGASWARFFGADTAIAFGGGGFGVAEWRCSKYIQHMKVRTPHVRARLVGRIPSKHVARYKNMAFGCLGGAYIVNGMMLKVVVGQARWICSNRPFP